MGRALVAQDTCTYCGCFKRTAEVLSAIGIAHLELRELPRDGTFGKSERPPLAALIRKAFSGVLILNSDYDFERAQGQVEAGFAEVIAFGLKRDEHMVLSRQ